MADDIIKEAVEVFDKAVEAESDNRSEAMDDLKFARLGEQWPADIKKKRSDENRPSLTINKCIPFIRQVVNDSRQNKPSIKVRPVDSKADIKTADVMSGLIRNIEQSSNADVAYDTAVDYAVSSGVGYIRVNADYSHDDTFDQDLTIERVSNPFTVYGDPTSQAADSSDWNTAFVTKILEAADFKTMFPGAEEVDWKSGLYSDIKEPWREDDSVMVAEYWKREEVEKTLLRLSDGQIMLEENYIENQAAFAPFGVVPAGQTREVKTHKVTQYLLTGAEVLKTVEWQGRYIPIIPVYGEELYVDGKRYFRSLIRDAKDAQRNFNYWRTSAAELVALAPKAPFIGEEGAFDVDPEKWASANTESHAYMEYAQGKPPPQRQPFAGVPAGALQEALNSSDDMKAIMGIHDASLGARSNETSGRAIMARQREGDVSTFHFIDNLARAIRHTGRILIDLIPHVYTGERIIRVLGEDGAIEKIPLNKPVQDQVQNQGMQEPGQPKPMGQQEAPATQIYNFSLGKYDLAVDSGPSFTTRREEAAAQMTDLIRAFPDAAPVIGDLLAKNLDWPGADEIAERLKAMVPNGNPETAKMQGLIKELTAKLDTLEGDRQVEGKKLVVEGIKLKIASYEAETKRVIDLLNVMEKNGVGFSPEVSEIIMQKALEQIATAPDISPPDQTGPQMQGPMMPPQMQGPYPPQMGQPQ